MAPPEDGPAPDDEHPLGDQSERLHRAASSDHSLRSAAWRAGEGEDDWTAEGLPRLFDTITEALVAFQEQMPKVRRTKTAQIDGKNGGRGYSYDYADLADLVEAATPLLTRLGFAFTCQPRRTEGGGYELVGELLHVCGESVAGALPIQGRTPQDMGSAITYARRYLLGCLTGLVTDDDDDAAMASAAGPTIENLLARIDHAATTQGIDREAITAKWREQHGGIPVNILPMLAPVTLLPLVEGIEAWIASQQ